MRSNNISFPRVVLYIVLLGLIAAAWLYYELSKGSSLSENFLAGAIEILITVIVIDGLLSLNRRQRMSNINAKHASETQFLIGYYLVGIIKEFGYQVLPSELEAVGMSNAELRKLIKDFLKSSEYRAFLQSLRDADQSILPKLKDIQSILEDSFKRVGSSLNEARPYPDPALTKLVSDAQPGIIGSFKIIDFLYETVYEKLPSIQAEHPNSSEKAISQSRDLFKKELRRLVSTGDGARDRANFHNTLCAYLDAILMVHEKAQENKLFYDV